MGIVYFLGNWDSRYLPLLIMATSGRLKHVRVRSTAVKYPEVA